MTMGSLAPCSFWAFCCMIAAKQTALSAFHAVAAWIS